MHKLAPHMHKLLCINQFVQCFCIVPLSMYWAFTDYGNADSGIRQEYEEESQDQEHLDRIKVKIESTEGDEERNSQAKSKANGTEETIVKKEEPGEFCLLAK